MPLKRNSSTRRARRRSYSTARHGWTLVEQIASNKKLTRKLRAGNAKRMAAPGGSGRHGDCSPGDARLEIDGQGTSSPRSIETRCAHHQRLAHMLAKHKLSARRWQPDERFGLANLFQKISVLRGAH
jgi:hypothetical protein